MNRVSAVLTDMSQEEISARAIKKSSQYNIKPFESISQVPDHQDIFLSSNAKEKGGISKESGLPHIPKHFVLTSDLNLPLKHVVHQCHVLQIGYVNCSARDLYDIPQVEFPINITVYNLSRNHITTLPKHAFSRYVSLKVLDLHRNKVVIIHPSAFVGLSNLEYLNLYHNRLIMNATTIQNAFSENVFVPLKNLKRLRLEGNNLKPDNKKLRYPHKALSHLGNLEELTLDGLFNASFESGFAGLSRLKSLSLEGYHFGKCKLTMLTNNTFRYLTPLEQLILKDCNLQGEKIEAGTFLPLKHLKVLHVSHNVDINIQFLDRIFYGLQNNSLQILEMNNVVNPNTVGICLSSKYIKYFPQSVEILYAKDNRLECIDRKVIDIIKKSLKVIDIGKNAFILGTYFMDLHKLDQLETLHVDDFLAQAMDLPRNYPYIPPLDTDKCSPHERTELEPIDDFQIHLPPKMKVFNMRFTGMRYVISKLDIGVNNSLKSMSFECNYFPSLKGPVTGLNQLQKLNLSHSFIGSITNNFFKTFPSLEILVLSSNNLGQFFSSHQKTKVFQNLISLKYLDLSSNSIRVLGRQIFHGMTELRYLCISHNPIYRFDPDPSNIHKLQAFIAVETSLSLLSKETRDVINQRIKMGFSFRVELDQSPILCDCPNLPFLEWMVTSGAFNFDNREYSCYFPDTSSMDIHDGYTEVLNKLSRQCSSREYLFFVTGAATAGFAIFIICSLAYRFRWKLRYMYYAAYIYATSRRNARSTNRFDYDVFICYAEEDRHFVMDMLYPALESRGLSVFVHHRHFTAGELIGSNIVRAVNRCRRTLVVLTRTLAESSWCNYEIQMANMASAQRGEPVLIFLLLGGVRSNEMGNELLYNIQTNTYIPFPSESRANEGARNALYDKLARDIRD